MHEDKTQLVRLQSYLKDQNLGNLANVLNGGCQVLKTPVAAMVASPSSSQSKFYEKPKQSSQPSQSPQQPIHNVIPPMVKKPQIDKAMVSEEVEKFAALANDTDRVEFIGQKIHKVNSPEGEVVLNQLLKELPEWISQDPVAWGQLSQMLSLNSLKRFKLSSITHFYQHYSLLWMGPLLEANLWQPILDSNFSRKLKAVARLHMFLCLPESDLIWQARRDFFQDEEPLEEPFQMDWRLLIHWVSEQVCILHKKNQEQLLSTLRAATPTPADVTPKDLMRLDGVPMDLPTIMEFKDVARQFDSYKVYSNLVVKQLKYVGIANSDLQFMSEQLGELTVSKKALSLLWARKALSAEKTRIWEKTSENRKTMFFVRPSPLDLESCVEGLSERGFRAVRAYLQIAGQLQVIWQQMHPHLVALKDPKITKGSSEDEIFVFLESLAWFGAKAPQLSVVFPVGHIPVIPGFGKTSIRSKWTMFFYSLIRKLGVFAWEGEGKNLRQLLEELEASPSQWHTMPVGPQKKWLTSLTSEQRKYFFDLLATKEEWAYPETYETLLKFLLRFAYVSFPSLAYVCSGLQDLQVPLWLYRDFEGWVFARAK